ncbi:NYN domain-containing protein [Gilliamella sp. Pas-s25]|uniref:NYN domain-containing protein n=1 Tax=Gilliamella sp. Pas-s25 TaxID=2687310 RepID=UPI00135DDB14|nr:NYN domain-containing protein [Gilliamella sp. Pas-s25]MWP63049.1 NYN domain-containing protein [Gilliamella sp. Pas-s25]
MSKLIQKLAVLIDADNISSDIVAPLLDEIAKYGITSVKRLYGDWSSPQLNKWKEKLLPYAITPVQQFAYTKGKNATDMAMVIDAMDLLYSNLFDIFCIVSSDSDFTRLALRIRENGIAVYGFGSNKTPESLRKACDKFIYLENLTKIEKNLTSNILGRKTPEELKQDNELIALIKNAIKQKEDELGWAQLGEVGQYMNNIRSDFDSRNYGYAKLSGLIKNIDTFEFKLDGSTVRVRIRPNTKLEKNSSIPASKDTNSNKLKSDTELINLIKSAIEKTKNNLGWAPLDQIGTHIKNTKLDFNVKNYGHTKLSNLIKSINLFEIKLSKCTANVRVRPNKKT